MGGRASFFANTVLPLKAAVSYYGGNIPPFLGRVGRAAGPLLLLWGDLDKHIPVAQRQQVADALRGAKRVFTEVVFSNADHGFFCDERPSYQPKAAAISWDLTHSFLNAHLA
jgi:carboxymethylenebutenolidase